MEPLSGDEFIKKIKKALAMTGAYTWEDIQEFLKENKMQMFHNERGLWITEILTTKRKKVLNCVITAGELDAVLELEPQIFQFAKEHKCDQVTGMCRIGYKKSLKEGGWKITGFFVTHELEDGK